MSLPAEPSDYRSSRYRIALVAAACATVIPVFVAAVRAGLNGFYPTRDVASIVLRARDTMSLQPPLIGMWSAGSSWAGHEIHFPGAIQLYVLALPTQLLGNSWGPLLAMATLNSAWLLLAGWLIYRRLGPQGAVVGFMFLAVFVWSLGSENLIDLAPMQMVTIPFLTFLIAVWVVADGDRGAIPALAIVANYLYLSHLVLTLLVPVIGLCAVGGQILWACRRRRTHDGQPGLGLRRPLSAAFAITVVMWLPSVIQEFRVNPGNLTLLFKAAGEDRYKIDSLSMGVRVMTDLIAKPQFWLRGSITDPGFLDNGDRLVFSTRATPVEVILAVAVVALFGALGFAAWRRRDRSALTLLFVAAVAVGASIVNVAQAPGSFGFPVKYLRSAWGIGAFVWFALAWNLIQLLKPRLVRSVSFAAAGLAVVFGVMALSYANFGAATDLANAPAARRMLDLAIPSLVDRGPVLVHGAPSFASQRFYPTLMLGLDAAGVPYCVTNRAASQFGKAHACAKTARTSVLV